MTATLNTFAATVAEVGPVVDGVVTRTAPALASTYPGPEPVAPAHRGDVVLSLYRRIDAEEARLARRRSDLHQAQRALHRMDALATELAAPDLAGAMRRPRDADRANARMDAGLARYVRARDRVELARARVTLSEARLRDLYAAVEASTLPRDVELEQALNTDPRSEA